MPTTVPASVHIPPSAVHDALKRHILVDGYHLVMDLDKSHGAFIFDNERGRDVLDFYTSFATCPLGYNHPKLRNPEFAARILPSALNKPANSDVYTTYLAEFVETFARTVPEPLRHHMFFVEGGALAIENALKTAFDWKVRRNLAAGRGEKGHQIIHFQECFHGRSGYTLSLTNTADPRKTQYFPKFQWPRVVNPKLSFPITDDVLAGVLETERRAVREIEQAVAAHPHDIAALIIETIQGEGGDNHFRPEFFRELRRLADEHEFLLIFDEVQSGFGTSGSWWAFEQMGVAPDIFAFGKKTQVCGICVSQRVDDVESVFRISSRINSTWGGNLFDMVRCQRIIEIIEEDDLLDNARRVGAHLLQGLRGLEASFPGQVTNARGRGMFLAFDLPDTDLRNRALKALSDSDVLGLSSGHRAIRFRPALLLSTAEADEGVRRVERALQGLL
jgi:L-lysine 6-transaminase